MKKLISIILILSLIIGFANISAAPMLAATASSSPQLNLVKGNSCFNVVWNKVDNARRYRLYFGANGNWRRYALLRPSDCTTYPKNLKSVQFLINHKSLIGKNWYLYGKDQHISTSNITSSNLYMCQIEALDGKNEHIAWSNVNYVFYSNIKLSASKTLNGGIKLAWNAVNYANKYQIAYRSNSKKPYTYVFLNKTTSWSSGSLNGGLYLYNCQIRPCYAYRGKIVAYGSWSNVAKVRKGYTSSNSKNAGLFTASSIGIKNLSIALGVEQYIIDNYSIGMYYRYGDNFNGNTVVLFGHNYKSFGKIKYLSSGNIVTVQGGGNTLTYKIYYNRVCTVVDDFYLVDNYSGQQTAPFYDQSQDIFLITCHESNGKYRYVVRGRLISIT